MPTLLLVSLHLLIMIKLIKLTLQCLIAGFTKTQEYNQGYYSYFIRSHFVYFDGQEGYVLPIVIISSSSSNLAVFS
jgi:hypothetical protein